MIAQRIYQWLDPATEDWPARLFRMLHHLIAGGGLAAIIMGTMASVRAMAGPALTLGFEVALAFFAAEYVLRLILAPEAPWARSDKPWRSRWYWVTSGSGIIDLAALAPFAAMAAGLPIASAHELGAVWVLKFARYSEGLSLVGRVLKNARKPIESLFLAFLVVLILSATLAYLAERATQPDVFSSIPAALWWAVVTLTTTGYGDVVPVTPLGRITAGIVMICGISVFAFLAGILANSFAEEMRRREFLRTWDLVANVPLFHDVGASTIAEVARLLKPRDAPLGTTVTRRGEPGDCMYFIVSGEIAIQIEPKPFILGPGQFFGEIALITGGPRTATALATKPCQLLVLDIADFHRLATQQPELMRAIDEEARRRLGITAARATHQASG